MKIEWREQKGIPPRILLLRDGEEIRKVSSRVVSRKDLDSLSLLSTWEEVGQKLYLLEEKGGMRLALTYLSRRAYHSLRLREVLENHFLEESLVEKIIADCVEKGYLDDTVWEEGRVASLKARGKSAKDIAYRLRKDGVSASFDRDDTASLEKLILKKYPELLEEGLSYKEKAKIIQSLLRRGFCFQDIQKFVSIG